jgi:multidrug efflux system membrane fusion protein
MTGCWKPPQAPPLPNPVVTVSQPVQREIAEAIEYTGNTAALESVEIRAQVKGYLQSINFKPRDRVKVGDLLFVIDPRPFQVALDKAAGDLAARKAELEKAEFDAQKINRLYKEEAAAEDERVDAKTKLDAARASIAIAESALAQAKLNYDYAHITAPTSGRISRNMVDAGNLVEPGTTLLATIVNDDSIYVYYNVSEADALRLKKRYANQPRPVNPPAYLGLMDEAGYPHEGFLDYIAPELDRTTGTIQVRGRFPNADGALLAGLFARIRVPVSKPKPALMVTERALGMDQGQRYVLVVNSQNQVEYRKVKVGQLADGMRVIEEGIGPQDWVVTGGLQRVRDGVTVSPQRTTMSGVAIASQPASSPVASSRAASKS